jgi:hypothetical protein
LGFADFTAANFLANAVSDFQLRKLIAARFAGCCRSNADRNWRVVKWNNSVARVNEFVDECQFNRGAQLNY